MSKRREKGQSRVVGRKRRAAETTRNRRLTSRKMLNERVEILVVNSLFSSKVCTKRRKARTKSATRRVFFPRSSTKPSPTLCPPLRAPPRDIELTVLQADSKSLGQVDARLLLQDGSTDVDSSFLWVGRRDLEHRVRTGDPNRSSPWIEGHM